MKMYSIMGPEGPRLEVITNGDEVLRKASSFALLCCILIIIVLVLATFLDIFS